MNTIKNKKNDIRAQYREKRLQLSPDVKKSLDAAICRAFVALATYRFNDTLLAYYPLEHEIDCRPIIEDALARGKKVALPRCTEKNGIMEFHYVKSLDNIEKGIFGLMEPSPILETYSWSEKSSAIMIVPGLVYDTTGCRIGYGKGYYDRYSGIYKGIKAGLCYSNFISPYRLPRGRFDMAVDFIVTEKGVRLVEKG